MRQTISLAAVSLSAAAILLTGAGNQRTFASPQEAGQALIEAAANNDTEALLKLFGPEGKDIVVSGDAAEDKSGRANFARRAREKMQVNLETPAKATLVVGNEDWPFPVPLVKKDGQWRFNSAVGKVEVLARRIGRNELNAVDISRGYVEAQMEYAAHDLNGDGILQYAQKIVSTPGKKDGLYWEGESGNLIPKSFADAAAALLQAGEKPHPDHGYYFHVLKAQGPDAPGGAMNYVVKGEMIGGFALIAWPADYGVSGVRSFIVNHHGVVYEKDLGPATATLARQIVRFNPDKSWKRLELE